MSGKLMGEVYGLQLTDTRQRVALAFADHGNDDGSSIYPSLGLVAWKIGRSERHVRRVVRELEEIGLLTKVAESVRHRATEYTMDTSAVPAKPAYEPKPSQSRADTQTSAVTPSSPDTQMSALTPARPDAAMSGLDESRADIQSTLGRTQLCPPNRHIEPSTTTSTPSSEKEKADARADALPGGDDDDGQDHRPDDEDLEDDFRRIQAFNAFRSEQHPRLSIQKAWALFEAAEKAPA